MDEDDIANASDEQLMRLLTFALKNDPAGPRMRKDPPKTRRDIINQLYWLGVLSKPQTMGKATLRTFIKEVLSGFANPNGLPGRDGVTDPLRFADPVIGSHGGLLNDDKEDTDAQEQRNSSMPRAAGVLIRRQDGKILAVSRKNDPTDFGLPGGKVDPGETPLQAAIRELGEETGLVANNLTQVFEIDDGCGYIMTTFVGDVSGEINTNEAGRVKWVSPEELCAGSFGKYNSQLLKHVYGE
jgi:mutator protein MutT